MNSFVSILLIVSGLLTIYTMIVQRIAQDQKKDWEEFVRDNPHLFHQPKPNVQTQENKATTQQAPVHG